MEIAQRIWGRVGVSGDCLVWLGARDKDGYGYMNINGWKQRVHRIVFRLLNGVIPEGMCILHHCDNPPCINPSHIYLGTKRDNAIDRSMRDRANQKGDNNNHARLNQRQVDVIRAKRRSGMSFGAIASEYGVRKQTVFDIVKERIWKTSGN